MKCFLILFSMWCLVQSKQRGYREQDFPYQVYISSQIDGVLQMCLGAIISSNYILTAGRCVNRHQKISINFNPEYVYSSQLNVYNPRDIILHPGYISKSGYNDVVLIKLSQALKFKPGKSPVVKLPKLMDYFNSFIGNVATVSQSVNNEQNYIPTTIHTGGKCQRFYGPLLFDDDTKFCLTSEGTKPVLPDELEKVIDGSLLTVQSKDDGRPVLIGISAKGNHFGKTRTTEYPGIFTKLTKILPWIYLNSDVNQST